MPVLDGGQWRIDYSDDGAGEAVVLIHSSVSGNRQWRRLVETLQDRYRVLAINLFGYGETTPWPGGRRQTLADQAELVLALCAMVDGPVRLAGHSFGGSVAMKAAMALGARAESLVLVEPNPFYLLEQAGRAEAFAEIGGLRAWVKEHGRAGDWETVARRFSEYWAGPDSWDAMTDRRRAAFVAAMPPNFDEWDAMTGEPNGVDALRAITARTLVVTASGTRRPIREIAAILRGARPDWRFVELADCDHMAPLARPDLVNPVIADFFDAPRP